MSVYQPKNSPHWHYDFQWKGHRYHGSTGSKSKRDALRYEAKVRHDVLFPPAPGKPPITLDEAAGLRMDRIEQSASWPTVRPMLTALVEGIGGNRLLAEIAPLELQRHVARRRVGRSNASVNREIDEYRAVWKAAERGRFDIGDMPHWADLRLPVPAKPPRELARDTEQVSLEAAASDDCADILRFAILSGWRKAEIIGLRWSDCDLGNMCADTRIKGGDTVRRALSGALVAIIANQPRVGPFVFTYVCLRSRAGRKIGQRYPMTVTALRTRWAKAKAEGGIEGLRFHDLRHTTATRIVRATGSLAAAKEALKHRSIKTTLRYAHVLESDVRDALDAAESRTIPERANVEIRKVRK